VTDATVSDVPGTAVLEDLFQHAPCGYIVLDGDGVIFRINATLLGWLGYGPDDAKGRRMTDLLKVSGRVFYETSFEPMLRLQGFCHEVAFDLKCKDGTLLSVLASATAGDNGMGRFTRVAFFRAARRRQFERSLVEARDAATSAKVNLSARNAVLRSTVKKAISQKREAVRGMQQEQETGELREQFVAVLGHDLRNPLAAILAGTRVLTRQGTSERAARVIQLMEGSVRRMSGLIDNVLDFARGRLGGGIGLELRREEHFEAVIQQVVDELRAGAPDRRISTEVHLAGPIVCDGGRVAQLLSNLLGNALSHGSEGKPVFVRAISSADGALELSVANSGEAIASEVMERLFEPFVRGQAKGYQQGLGLGLHIASEIAKAHGGTLAVTSTEAQT
jgi:sigma-B regulation protein RsbU (phosphoserine phosphatase)